MSPASVTDSLSNRKEHVVELAELLGKGRKRALFAAVYKGKKQTKTVKELAESLGLDEKAILTIGGPLVAAHAFNQIKINGRVAYSKIEQHKAIKDRVLKAAGNRAEIEKIVTKRNPTLDSRKPIFSPAATRSPRTSTKQKLADSGTKTRLAFLLASPSTTGAINVGLDFREAERAINASARRDLFALKPFLAADYGALITALNEFKPHVVHFSGHGGEQALLLDTLEIQSVGGMAIDFEAVAGLIGATSHKPKLIVIAACNTVDGADAILQVCPFVIAMNDAISDVAAAYFSRAFYGALASGQSIRHSFEQARIVLAIENLPDKDLPVLLAKSNSDPLGAFF
jgi:CHAT domain